MNADKPIQCGELTSRGFDLLQELIDNGNTKATRKKVSAYVKEAKAYAPTPTKADRKKAGAKREGGAA